MLGRKPVIDRDHRQIELSGQFGAERLVRFEVAEHEAPAVEEVTIGPGPRLSRASYRRSGMSPAGPGAARWRMMASSPNGASATCREACIMRRASAGLTSCERGPGRLFR
jgi:hypothetical protein